MEILVIVSVLVLVLVVTATVFVVRSRRAGGRPADARRSVPAEPAPAKQAAARATKRDGLGARVREIFAQGGESSWEALEDLLVRADVGPTGSADLVTRVRADVSGGADPAQALRDEVTSILSEGTELNLEGEGLSVVMVVGVNGAGKTTTIGKLARYLTTSGRKVTLAGSDTFRAAAGEQLDVWAERSGASLVKQDRGADPGAVAFDGVKSAQAKGSDVLIVDTAGRLHTKIPLMDELKKVRRSIEKAAGAPPTEVLLVLDATTGQNGISQARVFTEAVGVTGVALTKLDGSAKGGIVIAVREELGVPVKLVGTGEGADDLQLFDPAAFSARLID